MTRKRIFDHLSDRTGLISSFVYTSGTERLPAELTKCDVVCANCHRERTYRRIRAARRVRDHEFPEGDQPVPQRSGGLAHGSQG